MCQQFPSEPSRVLVQILDIPSVATVECKWSATRPDHLEHMDLHDTSGHRTAFLPGVCGQTLLSLGLMPSLSRPSSWWHTHFGWQALACQWGTPDQEGGGLYNQTSASGRLNAAVVGQTNTSEVSIPVTGLFLRHGSQHIEQCAVKVFYQSITLWVHGVIWVMWF